MLNHKTDNVTLCYTYVVLLQVVDTKVIHKMV